MNEVKLDSPGVPKLIEKKLQLDIDNYTIKTYWEPHRWHLGASLIGNECSRYLWYVFRWCYSQVPQARMLRLWNRGHREEERFIEFIRGIGGEMWTHDENKQQFRMHAVNGHFGGSLDGVLKLPLTYNIPKPLLAEFKTNGTGKGFNDTVEKGVIIAKPQHWAQMCSYGNAYKLTHAVYFIVNKNDDDMSIQIVKLDWKLGEQMIAKAERIIYSQKPPPKISENPTFWKCQYCEMKQICHEGKKAEFNCRSCRNASPADKGEWFCNFHKSIIPRDFVKLGCPSYNAIV